MLPTLCACRLPATLSLVSMVPPGVPRSKSGVSASCVAAYRLTGTGAEPSGLLVPQGLRMLSYVRALPFVDGFLTGVSPPLIMS